MDRISHEYDVWALIIITIAINHESTCASCIADALFQLQVIEFYYLLCILFFEVWEGDQFLPSVVSNQGRHIIVHAPAVL